MGPAGSGGEGGTRGAAACPVGYTRKLQSCAIPCCVPDAGTNGTCCQLGRRPGPHPNGSATLAVPTDVQLAWQDFEVGALNSFQMVTFWGGQLSADRPFNLSRAAEFTAQDLDTDQWAEAVVAMGGKYQVLNVKDESGFLLWPTKCKYSNGTVCACLLLPTPPPRSPTPSPLRCPHSLPHLDRSDPYTVASSPHAAKNGDLLQRFTASNKKRGIRSGIYYLGWGNFFMNITNSGVRATSSPLCCARSSLSP